MEHGTWYATLSPREQATVDHALEYAANFSHAGVPGHSAHLLIAKLVQELDRMQSGPSFLLTPDQQAAFDAWQKQVNTSLLTPAEHVKVDTTQPPDTSKRPKGFT